MVVVSNDDLQVGVVVYVTNAHIQAIAPITTVPLAVAISVSAGTADVVISGPRRPRDSVRPIGSAISIEDKDLRPACRGGLGLSGCGNDLDAAVAVQVGRCEAAHFGRFSGRRSVDRPSWFSLEPIAAPFVSIDLVCLAADDFVDAVSFKVSDDTGSIDAAAVAVCAIQQVP
ncbi:MAG: hypothetical protein ABFD82_06885 [Syntrophaceae bacterium]